MAEPLRRLSPSLRRVLAVLCEDPFADHYGLTLVRTTGLSAASLYPALARLERSGWIEGYWEEGGSSARGPRRRLYRMTSAGYALARLSLNVSPLDKFGGGRIAGSPI